jgi:hypothetical protein
VTFTNDREYAFTEFDTLAGSRVILKAKAKGKNPDRTLLEPVLSIFDSTGNLLGMSGDPGGQRSAVLNLIAPQTGTYFAVVSPGAGSFGSAVMAGTMKLPKSKRKLQEGLD